MHSFLPTEQTAGLVFFNLCLLLLMYALMKKALRPPHIVALTNRNLTVLLMLIFVLFSFWGLDWFSYQSSFEFLSRGMTSNIEEVYVWIAQYLSPNYLTFRFIIWGTSLCVLLHIFKRLSIPTHLAIFFFCTIYIIWFSYARVTAAMVLLFYGLTILYKPYKQKLLSILLGGSAICCAFFFHKSSLFGIAAVLLTILVTKFEKKTLIIILLCYPILFYFVKSYMVDFMISDLDTQDSAVGNSITTAKNYLDKEKGATTPFALVTSFFERFPYFLLAFLSFLIIKGKNYVYIPDDIKAFLRLQIFIVLMSSFFMFDLGANTTIIYHRFLRFAMIPSCIVLTYFYSVRFKFKYTQIAYYIAFAGTLYTLLYRMYKPL